MSHREIASTVEPWILLPLIYMGKKEGSISEYSHITSHKAFTEFIRNLPNQADDYNKLLREFVLKLYSKQCKLNETYFLDKTPRYYLIIPEIAKLFPEGKFIFLFRNPVQIFSSFLTTFENNRLKNIHQHDIDLIDGPKFLSQGFELLREKAYALKYEDFILNPQKYMENICSYLKLEFQDELLHTFSKQTFNSKISDQTGTKDYNTIDQTPLEKWKRTFSTSFRKRLLKKYISRIDDITMSIQGYNKNEIMKDIELLPEIKKWCAGDRLDYTLAAVKLALHSNLFFSRKLFRWVHNRYVS